MNRAGFLGEPPNLCCQKRNGWIILEHVGVTVDIFLDTANMLKLRTAKKHFQKNAKKEESDDKR